MDLLHFMRDKFSGMTFSLSLLAIHFCFFQEQTMRFALLLGALSLPFGHRFHPSTGMRRLRKSKQDEDEKFLHGSEKIRGSLALLLTTARRCCGVLARVVYFTVVAAVTLYVVCEQVSFKVMFRHMELSQTSDMPVGQQLLAKVYIYDMRKYNALCLQTPFSFLSHSFRIPFTPLS